MALLHSSCYFFFDYLLNSQPPPLLSSSSTPHSSPSLSPPLPPLLSSSYPPPTHSPCVLCRFIFNLLLGPTRGFICSARPGSRRHQPSSSKAIYLSGASARPLFVKNRLPLKVSSEGTSRVVFLCRCKYATPPQPSLALVQSIGRIHVRLLQNSSFFSFLTFSQRLL